MTAETIKHYEELLKQHGPGARAVQHSDREQQTKRFEILFEMAPDMHSVLDVGCGLGDMAKFMEKRFDRLSYIGVDFVRPFIDHANSLQYRDNVRFVQMDIRTEPLPGGQDYALLSGVFNNVMPDNESFMLQTLKKMFDASARGIAFNCLSTWVDYQADDLYYTDPEKVFAFCKSELSPKVVLRHDYQLKKNTIPFEYTMYVYR